MQPHPSWSKITKTFVTIAKKGTHSALQIQTALNTVEMIYSTGGKISRIRAVLRPKHIRFTAKVGNNPPLRWSVCEAGWLHISFPDKTKHKVPATGINGLLDRLHNHKEKSPAIPALVA